MAGGALVDYADLASPQQWAAEQMARAPDFIIGDDYLRRWWVVPRNRQFNVYLHEILHNDDDRALHDHPWDNVSFVIDGGYIEHNPAGRVGAQGWRRDYRRATDAHRLEIPEGGRAVSPFCTGAIDREWASSALKAGGTGKISSTCATPARSVAGAGRPRCA